MTPGCTTPIINQSTLSNNKKQTHLKDTPLFMDHKNQKPSSSSRNRKTNGNLISERSMKNDPALKVRNVLSSKFEPTYSKKKFMNSVITELKIFIVIC